MKTCAICTGIALTILLSIPAGWANPSDITWTDDVANNPVILEPGLTDANRAYYGCVIFDPYANIWRAWFDASSGADVGYGASSDPDGISWGSYKLCKGFETSYKQSKPFVIQLGGNSFRMWYTGDDRVGGYLIYTCVSSDGVTWSQDQWVNGIAEPDPTQYGPIERFAAARLSDGSFVAYVRCDEPEVEDAMDGKWLYRYTSSDGINWTWTGYTEANDDEGMEGLEFSSVVKHPDREGVWYAWGNAQNSSGPFYSFVSVDDGLTFTLDENPVADIGEIGTQSYNPDRNYHPSTTYLGNGKWVMFRSVADPKATARATGVEQGLVTDIPAWELF